MAVTAGNVRVGLTGAISKGALATAAPTTAVSVLDAAFKDSGAISEDGVTLTLPDSGDSTPIKIWQNGQTVRTLRTTSDDLPTLSFTMLETNKTSVETYFGVTVTQTASHGTFDYTGATRTPSCYVLDVVDGAVTHRYHVPRGATASVGDVVYQNGEAVGFEVTIECELDATAGYNFRAWMTDLKTP